MKVAIFLESIIFSLPFLAFLPFVVFSLWKPRKVFKSADFIVLLYFFFLAMGFLYTLIHPEIYKYPPNIFAMLYLILCLAIYILPITVVQRRSVRFIDLGGRRLFFLLCLVFALGSFISIVFFFFKVYDVFVYGVGAYRLDLNYGNATPFQSSIVSKVSVLFSLFFGFVQLLGLIVIVTDFFGKRSKVFGLILIFLSTSYVLNSLAFAGRDGVVFWILSLLFNVVFIRSLFSVDSVNFVFRWLFFLGLILVVPFIMISVARFGSGTVDSIFYYIAHQLSSFNDYFSADLPLYYGEGAFSDIKRYLGFDVYVDRGSFKYEYLQRNVVPWTWGYFIGSLIFDFGKFGTFFFLCALAVFVYVVVAKKTKSSVLSVVMPIDIILVFYLYCQIGIMGVFYFKHAVMNNYMIAVIILSFTIYLLRVLGGGYRVKVS